MSDQPDATPNPPLLKKRTLLTGAPAGEQAARPKLFSPATAEQAAPQARFMTPEVQAQLIEEQSRRAEEELKAQQDAEHIRQEAERLAAEQAENERIEAERRAAEQAENERLAAEQAERERLQAEQAQREEQERIAAAQAAEEAQQHPLQTAPADELDAKVKMALEQLKEAQEALLAAQATASAQTATSEPSPEPVPPVHPIAASPFISPRVKLASPGAAQSAGPQPAAMVQQPSLTPPPPLSGSVGTPASVGIVPPISGPAYGSATVPEGTPIPVKSKKTLKFGIIAVCIAAIGCGVAYYYVSERDAKIKEANTRYSELQKIGLNLGRESAALGEDKGGDVLKYDSRQFKTQVKPSLKDADFLLDHIRKTQDPTGAKAAIHLLAVMGQLDPQIALKTITDITDNPKAYTKTQISMLTSILASAKNPKVMQHLWLLQRKLSASNQKELEATVLREMRLGLDPNSVTNLMKLLLNPDSKVADSRIIEALGTAIPSVADKADDAGKSIIAEEIVKALNGASGKEIEAKRLNIAYQALALTGKPMALSFFRDTVKKGTILNKITAVRAMKSYVNDDAIPLLREFLTWKDSDLEKSTSIRDIKNSIASILGNRLGQRNDEEGKALFQPELDQADALSAKAAAAPDDTKLAQEAQDSKMMILSSVSIANEEYPYVKDILDKLIQDSDPKVAEKAKSVRKLISNRKAMKKERKGMSEAEKADYWQKRMNG